MSERFPFLFPLLFWFRSRHDSIVIVFGRLEVEKEKIESSLYVVTIFMHTPIVSIIRECFWRHDKCDTRRHLHYFSLSLPRESFDDWVRGGEASRILIKSYFHPHDSVDKLNLVERNVISTIVVVISIMWKILHRLLLLHSSWRFSVNFTHNGAELRSIVVASWLFSPAERGERWYMATAECHCWLLCVDDEDHLLALCKISHAFPYHTELEAQKEDEEGASHSYSEVGRRVECIAIIQLSLEFFISSTIWISIRFFFPFTKMCNFVKKKSLLHSCLTSHFTVINVWCKRVSIFWLNWIRCEYSGKHFRSCSSVWLSERQSMCGDGGICDEC